MSECGRLMVFLVDPALAFKSSVPDLLLRLALQELLAVVTHHRISPPKQDLPASVPNSKQTHEILPLLQVGFTTKFTSLSLTFFYLDDLSVQIPVQVPAASLLFF